MDRETRKRRKQQKGEKKTDGAGKTEKKGMRQRMMAQRMEGMKGKPMARF